MKRTLVLLSIVGLILVLAATHPASAAKSYFAERYDTTVMVQPDGALNVTETVIFRFEGGPFTYVFRDLRYADLDEIDRLQASLDGQVLPQGTQAGQVEITAGHPLKVTWHFPATSDSTHEFTLVYRVQGAIRQDSTTDILIWRAIPEEHDYEIRHSMIRIEYPPGVNPTVSPALTGVTAAFEAAEQGAVFTTQEVGKNTPVDVSVSFPSGSLISQPPTWQAAQEQKDRQIKAVTPYGLGAAALTGVIGLLGILFYSQSFRREAGFVPQNESPFTSPPGPIPPTLAARLVGSNTAFLGTFFDLAQRGVLQIEEGPKKWRNRTFEVIYLPNAGGLSSYEQVLWIPSFARRSMTGWSWRRSLRWLPAASLMGSSTKN